MKVANLNKIAPESIAYANFLLAPPPCQVEEQAMHIEHGKGRVRFNLPAEVFKLPFGGKQNKQAENTANDVLARADYFSLALLTLVCRCLVCCFCLCYEDPARLLARHYEFLRTHVAFHGLVPRRRSSC